MKPTLEMLVTGFACSLKEKNGIFYIMLGEKPTPCEKAGYLHCGILYYFMGLNAWQIEHDFDIEWASFECLTPEERNMLLPAFDFCPVAPIDPLILALQNMKKYEAIERNLSMTYNKNNLITLSYDEAEKELLLQQLKNMLKCMPNAAIALLCAEIAFAIHTKESLEFISTCANFCVGSAIDSWVQKAKTDLQPK